MIVLKAMLAAIVVGAAGCVAFGAGAAIWMSSIYGSQSGGVEMSSLFTFGPIGGLAGVLLGIGITLRFSHRPGAKGLIIASAAIAGLAIVALFAMALSHTNLR
jgi:hypothetical protein